MIVNQCAGADRLASGMISPQDSNSIMDTMYKREIRRSHMAGGLMLWLHFIVVVCLIAA